MVAEPTDVPETFKAMIAKLDATTDPSLVPYVPVMIKVLESQIVAYHDTVDKLSQTPDGKG